MAKRHISKEKGSVAKSSGHSNKLVREPERGVRLEHIFGQTGEETESLWPNRGRIRTFKLENPRALAE